MNDKKLNDSGFSLIEMIVSILIVAIMMVGLSAFISISRMTYQDVSTSSKLQEEANVTTRFIDELLAEAQDYGWVKNKTIFSNTYTILCIKTLDNSATSTSSRDDIMKRCYYFIFIDEASGVISYSKVDYADAPGITFEDAESVSGSGIKDIRTVSNIDEDWFEATIKEPTDRKYYFIADSLDVSSALSIKQSIEKNGRRITIVLNFTYNGESFVATVNNFLRNKLTF